MRTARTPLLLVATLLLAAPAFPQGDASSVPGLVELAGRAAWVKHTPGSLDRASHVQDWLAMLAVEHVKAGAEPVVLGAYVIDRREWEEAGIATPYGLPRMEPDGRIELPAYGDDGTVAFWRKYQPRGLPRLGGVPIRGTETEAATLLLADNLGLLETARFLSGRTAPRGAEPWLQELLAHAFLLQALERNDPGRIEALDAFWGQIAAAVPDPGSRHEYGAGVTFPQWLAYQARFHRLARTMAEREHRLTKLYDRLQKLGKRRDGVLTEDLLRKRYGGLVGD